MDSSTIHCRGHTAGGLGGQREHELCVLSEGHRGTQPETGYMNSREFWFIDKDVGVNRIEVPEATGMEKMNQGK